MLTEDQKAKFRSKGFLIVPRVLTAEQVAALRTSADALMAEPSPFAGDLPSQSKTFGGIRLDVFARYPELRWLMFHNPIVSALRSLLGDDFICVPESGLHKSVYGGWHKDTFAQEKVGLRFSKDPGYLMVQAAIYLQDNDEFGGGLDIVPRSQYRPIAMSPASGGKVDMWRHRIAVEMRERLWKYSVPSKAGDLVIFDFRTDHRASQPQKGLELPVGRHKLALFWAAGRNDRTTFEYIDFIRKRPDYIYLRDHAYPDDMVTQAKSLNIQMPA